MREEELLKSIPQGLLVGGRWVPAKGDRTLEVTDPSTGQVLAEGADASPDDGLAALDLSLIT